MPNNKIIDLDRLSRFKDKLDVELEKKANVDGNYPTMTVGAADSLTPYGENSGATDTTPFVFQSTGGSSDVGSKAYLRALRGNTVAFNQLANITGTSETINGVTFTNNNDGSWTISGVATGNIHKPLNTVTTIKTHRFLVKGATSKVGLYVYDKAVMNTDQIFTYNGNTVNNYLLFYIASGTDISTPIKVIPQLFNLTFIEQNGKTYSSILEFNRDYPKPYYPYNAGALLSCKTNGIKNVGYNAFDGIYEEGTISLSTGQNYPSSTAKRTPNYIKVIPGQTYTFEVDNNGNHYLYEYDTNKNYIKSTKYEGSTYTNNLQLTENTCFIRFVVANATNNSCFHLTWDGSRTGCEEHEEWQYNLPNIELKSAGSAYDVLYSTGGGKRRIGVVDLGTLNWQTSGLSTETNHIWYVNNFDGKVRTPNLSSVKYVYVEESLYSTTPNTVCVLGDNSLRVNTGSSSETPTGLLFYELATETDITIEENPGWQNPQDIDDFGTQEFLYDSDIDIPIPQGNEFFYPVDYKAFIDSLGGREDIEYAADQVVSQTQLQTALSTFLSSISGYDATKTQTLKNVNGVFQWVDD